MTTWKFNQPEEKEDDLDATDDGEPSEEPHCASNETQLSLVLDLLVSLNLVKSFGFSFSFTFSPIRLDLLLSLNLIKGGRVKVDLYQLEGGLWQLLS